MGKKSAQNLVTAIEDSKQQSFARVLYGLGIRYIGRTNAKLLIKNFPSIDTIQQAKVEDLEAIYGIGVETAQSIFEWFKIPENLQLIQQLKTAGLCFQEQIITSTSTNTQPQIFTGKTFVITGTLPTLKRKEAENIIKQLGGEISSSISKKTSYLLLGENAGSKLTKARKLGIEEMSEEELLSIKGKG